MFNIHELTLQYTLRSFFPLPPTPFSIFYLSLNPSPRGEGLNSLLLCRFPPSFLGEGGKGDEVKHSQEMNNKRYERTNKEEK
jgi:hypothetical protein